jgi:prefoldin subunit 5
MKSKKVVVNYSNINEYTRNKIDSDIDKVNKAISVLEDFIFHFQDKLDEINEELVEQKELLNKLNNLKRFN